MKQTCCGREHTGNSAVTVRFVCFEAPRLKLQRVFWQTTGRNFPSGCWVGMTLAHAESSSVCAKGKLVLETRYAVPKQSMDSYIAMRFHWLSALLDTGLYERSGEIEGGGSRPG